MSSRCVVLVGMMGAGKSQVGRLLAENLGYDFVDTDLLIVKRAGKSIPRIFSEDGEDAFRVLERAVIAELARRQSLVIATGGGALLDEANRRVLSALGHTVYLKASPRELYLRVKNDRNRPLLNVPDPQGELRRLLDARAPLYEKCDIVVDTEDIGTDEVVDLLIDELAKRTIETQME